MAEHPPSRRIFPDPRFTRALRMLEEAVGFQHMGRFAEADKAFARVIKKNPDYFDALNLYGVFKYQQGRPVDALKLLTRAAAINPRSVASLNNLGVVHNALGRPTDALAVFDKALTLEPGNALTLANRGNVLVVLNRPQEALASYDRAISIRVDEPDAHRNRGNLLLQLGRGDEALASYDCAIAAAPMNANAHSSRGGALLKLNRPREALASLDRALAINPRLAEALNNRGSALTGLNRPQEAITSFDAALAIEPTHPSAHSNKIFALDFSPTVGFAEHQNERKAWAQAQLARLPKPPPHHNTRDPQRPLVLGYVSADFRQHSAATCFGPVIRNHDRSAFRVICYSGVVVEDAVTAQFRSLSDSWRPASGMSDEVLAAQIRADKVDILIDLSGHSEGNRLPVFARRPAPVQITAWGHATGTGLPTIDCIFADSVALPASARPLFAEMVYDLPCTIAADIPVDAPPVADLPALAKGYVTFGCLNRFSKVSPAVRRQHP